MDLTVILKAVQQGGLAVIAVVALWLVWKVSANCEERMSESNQRLCDVLDRTAEVQEKHATAIATLTEVIRNK